MAEDLFLLKKPFPLHRCEAAHSQIISKERCFPVFMEKALQCSWLGHVLSFVEDISGVTNTTLEDQSCQTQKPPWATAVLPMNEMAAIPLWASVGSCAHLIH